MNAHVLCTIRTFGFQLAHPSLKQLSPVYGFSMDICADKRMIAITDKKSSVSSFHVYHALALLSKCFCIKNTCSTAVKQVVQTCLCMIVLWFIQNSVMHTAL
ncbi:hypothetical protein NQD34_009520 [Periophthalmus magnuspinnatus]|nr:hypothetical protein NQD34_009520 [Periophthalmus magnuspinnatus]